MKQQIEIVILSTYKDKTLLRYSTRSNTYSLLNTDLLTKTSPEEVINLYFQKRFKVIPETSEIIGTYDDYDDKFFIVYHVTVGENDYLRILNQKKDALWVSQNRIRKVQLDDLAEKLLCRFEDQIFAFEQISGPIQANAKYILYTDGGSRGNPGHAAIGYAIYDDSGISIHEGCEYIGIAVSGMAEYQAVLRGLEVVTSLGIKNIELRVDNLMIAKQLNGAYKVKNREFWPIYEKVVNLCQQFDSLRIVHIKREFNEIADRLVNKALDDYLTNV